MLREATPTRESEPLQPPWRQRPQPSPRVLRRRQTVIELLLVALTAALVPLRHNWAAATALLLLLLTVPGTVLLRALRVPGDAIFRTAVYVPCASIVVLIAAGLGVDLLAPQIFGVAEPLRTWPIFAGVEGLTALLLVIGATAPLGAGVPWRMVQVRAWRAWPLLLPLAAGAGALRLTAGHGPTVATIALAAAVATLLVSVVVAERVSRSTLSMVLYGVGLAAMWSFSLRGQFVYGFDIASEYHVVSTTYGAGVWHAAHPHDAYGAMLSLTVLPSTLHALTGISSLVLLKAVYPAIFALFPVGMFALAERFLSRRYAFIAAAFILVQAYFFQQLSAIARQEMALLMFVVLCAAVLDRGLPNRSRWPLVALFAAGVAVSHYSTAYLAIAMFGLGMALMLLVSRFRPVPAVNGAIVVAFVATLASAAVWYTPVTHSSDNLSQFTQNVRDHGLDLLPNSKPGQSPVKSYLSGNQPKRIPAAEYQRDIQKMYALKRPYVKPAPGADSPRYALKDTTIKADAVRHERALNLVKLGQLAASQIANILAVLGALLLVFSRRSSPWARQVGILGLSTLAFVAFVRLSGTAANAYNQERAFVQTMVPLGIGMAFLLEATGRRLRRHGSLLVTAAAVAGLALIFFSTTGLRSVALGGSTQTNLAAKGEDYERFYVTEPELKSALWLDRAPSGSIIYADRYGQLRWLEATGRSAGLLLDVTPQTIAEHGWVYASRSNLINRHTRGEQGQRYAIYEWPGLFLDERFNTVYTNGSSAVYHR
jgi:uncharacterized membrane protein